MRRDFNHNEVLTIDRIVDASQHGVGITAVHLTSPVAFDHYAGVEYQAEVALLTRPITVQGDPSSEPSGSDASSVAATHRLAGRFPNPTAHRTGFGGHIMVDGTAAMARLSGVELYSTSSTHARTHARTHAHTQTVLLV